MPQPFDPKRPAAAALLFACLFFASPASAADEPEWVRIHQRAEHAALQARDIGDRLADYGSFQWGKLEQGQIERLRGQGLSVTVEENPFELTLGGRSFDPLEEAVPAGARSADPEGDFHLVQFRGPIRPDWVRTMRARGVKVVQPVHPFSYVVWARSRPMSAVAALPSVRWSGLMRAEWKVPPSQRSSEAGLVPTMALASAHVDESRLSERLAGLGRVRSITPLNSHSRVVHLDADRRDYAEIAEIPGIYTIQYIPPEAGPRGEMSNQSIVGAIDGGGTIQPGYATWLNDTGYNGSGVIVGVVDGPVLTTHQDLADSITTCSGSNGSCDGVGSDNHGTHVAGAIAGTGATGSLIHGFLSGQGVAPGASIVSQIYGSFLNYDGTGKGSMVADGMLQIYQDSARSGALLTNNSWGPTGSPQGYDIPTQQIDFISRDADPDTPGNQPLLAVWSVMNGYGDDLGDCAPSSLGSPDEAKNLFAVGSTALQSSGGAQLNDIFRVSANSAHGPACDGRRVPHIVAPGCSTDSTSNAGNTAHTRMCGTSMASPVVSGSVAVWAQKYITETGTNPSPALVKAVFTAAARDLEGEVNADGVVMGHRPDRFQGYGRIDLETVMNHGLEVFHHDQKTVFDTVGQDWSLNMTAVDPGEPIRIVLAWTDAPGHGLGGTTPAWVNDLDLSVTAGGDTYLGNVIGPDGWSATGGAPDGMNNLEGIFLSPAQHGGGVDITVTASDLAGDALDPYDPGDPSQDFALACYNCVVTDPTYTIQADPDTLEACIPDSGSSDIDVDVALDILGGYSGTVGLGTSGEPAGVTSQLAPTSVSPPGASVWTVTVADSASPGTTPLSANGDDGSDQHSSQLSLTLETRLTDTPVHLAPADGAVDASLTPSFEWDPLAGIDEYRLQVASDSGFGNIVIDEAVAGTSFTPSAELASDTQYHWRVSGINACGSGDPGATRSFTTVATPEAAVSPASFALVLFEGQSSDQLLSIGNNGTGTLDWDIVTDQSAFLSEQRGSHDPARDEVLQVPDFTLGGGGAYSKAVPGGVATKGTVVGFTFEGTVAGISGTQAYASDLAMTVTPPGGAAYAVGGFGTSNPDWDFQGAGSGEDGSYASTHVGTDIFGSDGTADAGDWQFDFENIFEVTMDWTGVTVTLHKQAPPFCDSTVSTPAWLGVSPTSGSVAAGATQDVTVSVDTSGLSPGDYTGYICLTTGDPDRGLIAVEVRLQVRVGIFGDRFEDVSP